VDIEAMVHKETGDNSNEIHEMHNRITFIRPQKKLTSFRRINIGQVAKKLAECKQKLLNLANRMEDISYKKQLLDYQLMGRRRRT
jgi:hypothetical protein